MAGFMPLSVVLRLHLRGYHISTLTWVICAAVIVSVALSRLYMGVHSVLDLVSGALLAAICVGTIHVAGDDLDSFLYKSPESNYTWVLLVLYFIVYYPSTVPWSASTSTACQIFGLFAGLGSASWFAHVHMPDCWDIFVEHSLLKAYDESLPIVWVPVIARVVSGSILVLVVKTVSKAILNPIFIFLFKKFQQHHYNRSLMEDSLGNHIDVDKLYPVEIPVRYS